jgi:hypothetical protein
LSWASRSATACCRISGSGPPSTCGLSSALRHFVPSVLPFHRAPGRGPGAVRRAVRIGQRAAPWRPNIER